MSNDLDFDVMVSEISERAATIREPQVVVTIEKWVNKLVAEPRGPNELNYLKLLNRMMNNKRVGPPFLRPPPAGPLFPLSRYINPRPCEGRPSVGQTTMNWHTSSQNRSVQTAAQDQTPSRVPSLSSTDGHLPAGGCPCGIKTKAKGCKSQARSDNDVCNPCLDKVLRTADQVCAGLPDEYNGLLGDCTLPTLTKEEQRTVGPELVRVLKIIDNTTTLQDFYFQYIPPYTGIGSPEDTLQNCFSLMPKPPKTLDFVTYVLNAAKKLRYKLQLACVREEDKGREFILAFCLGNDQITIQEVPSGKNTGFIKSRFMSSVKLRKPNTNVDDQMFYGTKDFALGAEIWIRGAMFIIVGLDLWTYNYMVEHPHMFTQEAINGAKKYLEEEGLLDKNQEKTKSKPESEQQECDAEKPKIKDLFGDQLIVENID